MYVIQSGETCVVEALHDPYGLKIGLVYETEVEKKMLLFHRFDCKTDSVLTILELDGLDINYFGGYYYFFF
jgi:hypothetical protein